MTQGSATHAPADERAHRHVLGVHDCGRPGPTLLFQGAIHGNEPAGVRALERVLEQLRSRPIELRGRLVAVIGNLAALERKVRFVDRDLNRLWDAGSVEALHAQDPSEDDAEDREQRELITVYERFLTRSDQPFVLVDLHSSSADGSPFTCLADTLPNRRIARALPVPTILGLEECIDGAVMDYFSARGQIGIAIEGGYHDATATVDNLEAGIWIVAAAAGAIDADAVDLKRHRRALRDSARGLPPVLEIRLRHAIRPDDGFVMEPGFESFQQVAEGQLLARDARGELRAHERSYVLLPLYQGQGDDGYFLSRPIRPFWLKVSAALRRCGLDRILPWLPGVRRDPDDPNTLVVDRRTARWLAVEVFHLFGYRRVRAGARELRFSRRRSTDVSERVGRVD